MGSDAKTGLGIVGAMALCCGGPLILSALASGAVLGSLGVVWDAGGPLFVGVGALLIGLAIVWLVARRLASQAVADAACCAPPVPNMDTGHRDAEDACLASVGSERAPVDKGQHAAD